MTHLFLGWVWWISVNPLFGLLEPLAPPWLFLCNDVLLWAMYAVTMTYRHQPRLLLLLFILLAIPVKHPKTIPEMFISTVLFLVHLARFPGIKEPALVWLFASLQPLFIALLALLILRSQPEPPFRFVLKD